MRDESTHHEEDMEMLQEELRENEQRSQNYTQQMEHDCALLSQKVETLETYLKEKEERLSKEQTQSASQIELQLEKFNVERKEMFEKIERLNASITAKEREGSILKNKMDHALEESERKRKGIDETREEY